MMKKQLWFPGKNILATSSGSQHPLLLLLLQTKKNLQPKPFTADSTPNTHAGNPTKLRHKNDDKQCEAFRDSWSQYIYLQMVAEISREGGFYYTTLLIHVCALNPDIIQKLSLRESWQRNCRSPPPPNPCEKLAEIYSTICRSADFWRETGRRSTICRSADLLREPDGDLR